MSKAYLVARREYVENLRTRIPPERWSEQEGRLEASVDRVLALLAEKRTRGTFFILGVAVERHPSVVRRIHEAGHEVASHGWSHDLIYRQDHRGVYRTGDGGDSWQPIESGLPVSELSDAHRCSFGFAIDLALGISIIPGLPTPMS